MTSRLTEDDIIIIGISETKSLTIALLNFKNVFNYKLYSILTWDRKFNDLSWRAFKMLIIYLSQDF